MIKLQKPIQKAKSYQAELVSASFISICHTNKLRSSAATVILLEYVTLFTSARRRTPTVFLKFTSVNEHTPTVFFKYTSATEYTPIVFFKFASATRYITIVSDTSYKCSCVGYSSKWLKNKFALDRF